MSEEGRKRKKATPKQTDKDTPPQEKTKLEGTPTPASLNTDRKRASRCGVCCRIFGILLAILTAYLYFTPCPIDPVAIQLSEVPPEMPRAEIIKHITSPESLKLLGAECFVVHEATGYVYTGLMNGAIARFKLDLTGVEVLLRTADVDINDEYCDKVKSPEERCGRPLGMRLLDDNHLLVIDAYLGIFKINIVELTKELVLDFSKAKTDKPIKLGDDLVILPDDNTVYFTDVSYKHQLQDFLYEFSELRPRGRLFKFILDTGELTEVANELYFGNGVELHRDGMSLLVTETSRARILRYNLADGKIEMFAENLIATPDNIRRSPRGGYLVGMGSMRTPPYITDFIAAHPIINTMIFKLFSKDTITNLASPKHSLFVRLGEEGEMLDFYYDEKAEHIRYVSHAEEYQGYIYVGSFVHPHLLKIPV